MFSRTLSQPAQETLAVLGKSDILKIAYLAGGSALALQLDHRRSIDFDFFSQTEFDAILIKKSLQGIGQYQPEQTAPRTIVGSFNGIKFSLFHYPYRLIIPPKKYLGITVAAPEDIAAMKLVAITDRGTKKDFIDLFFLAQKKFPFEEMFKFYDQKYHLLESNLFTLIKSLQFFLDADTTAMPEMLVRTSWKEVKRFFEKEAVRLANKYL